MCRVDERVPFFTSFRLHFSSSQVFATWIPTLSQHRPGQEQQLRCSGSVNSSQPTLYAGRANRLQPPQMPPKAPARELADALSIAVSADNARSPILALASASKLMRLLSPSPSSRSGLPGSLPDISVLERQAAAGVEVDLCCGPDVTAAAAAAADN